MTCSKVTHDCPDRDNSQLEIIFRHGPGSDQETDLSLVPAPRIRLAQVGHLRVSGSQVGQISGENNIKTF